MIKDNQMNLKELVRMTWLKWHSTRTGFTWKGKGGIYFKHFYLYQLYPDLEPLYTESGYGCVVLKANDAIKPFFHDSSIHYCGFINDFENKVLFPNEDTDDWLINPEIKLGYIILSQNNQFYCVDVYQNKAREDYDIEQAEWLNFEDVRKIKKTHVYELLSKKKPYSAKRVIHDNQLNLEHPCYNLDWYFISIYGLNPYDDLFTCIKFDYNLKRLLADSNIALLQFVEINGKYYYIACQYNEYYKIQVDYMENSQDVKWLDFYFCSKLTKEEFKTFKEQAEKNGLW